MARGAPCASMEGYTTEQLEDEIRTRRRLAASKILRWSHEEDCALERGLRECRSHGRGIWNVVATQVATRTPTQCRRRWRWLNPHTRLSEVQQRKGQRARAADARHENAQAACLLPDLGVDYCATLRAVAALPALAEQDPALLPLPPRVALRCVQKVSQLPPVLHRTRFVFACAKGRRAPSFTFRRPHAPRLRQTEMMHFGGVVKPFAPRPTKHS